MKINYKYTRGSAMKLGVGVSMLFGVACAQLAAQETSPMGNADPMTSMAMDNMKRIMMMPEGDRMAYVQKASAESLARGERVFTDTHLGTNGQSCASCHVGGGTTGGKVEMMPGMKMAIPDLHGSAGSFPKFKVPNDAVITLPEMNNNCIVMMQKGKPLPLGSQESRDLAAYISSLK